MSEQNETPGTSGEAAKPIIESPQTTPPSLIDSLTAAAMNSKVTEWFGQGGQQIRLIRNSGERGWEQESTIVSLIAASTDDQPEVQLYIRRGGAAGNKANEGSGSYRLKEGKWIPVETKNSTLLPPLENNLILNDIENSSQLTPELVKTTVDRKIAVIPFTALPEQEKKGIFDALNAVEKFRSTITRDIILFYRSDFREEKLPRSFPDRIAYFESVRQIVEQARDNFEKYKELFSGRDEEITPPGHIGSITDAEDFVRQLGVDINDAEVYLPAEELELAVMVGEAISVLPREVFIDGDGLFEKCSNPEECIQIAREQAKIAEENGQIDIISGRNTRIEIAGKALEYEGLCRVLEVFDESDKKNNFVGRGDKRTIKETKPSHIGDLVDRAINCRRALTQISPATTVVEIQQILESVPFGVRTLPGEINTVVAGDLEIFKQIQRPGITKKELNDLIVKLPSVLGIRNAVRRQVVPNLFEQIVDLVRGKK